MADRDRRARGLRGLLPAAYDTSPRGSALGALLDALAGSLAALDAGIEQVVHDRWVRLAHEDPPPAADDPPAARRACLTQLGRLVGVVPLPREPIDRLRHRIVAQARILRAGVTTPRALLALAATALGHDLCRQLDKPAPRDGSRLTIGHAVPAGACRACPRAGACAQVHARVAQLILVDNPPDLRARLLPAVRPGDILELASESVADAQPTLRLGAPPDGPPVAWPSLQHAEETLFYAGTLAPGETLVVTPVRPDDEHSGTAVLLAPGRPPRPLARGAVVYFTTSARFAARDDEPNPARFAADDAGPDAVVTRFARFGETELRTPLLPAGGARWTVGQIDREQLAAMLGPAEAAARFAAAPAVVSPARFTLELTWTVFPAATFQLRIPRNPAVRAAEAHGAVGLIQELVELARGAGIAAWVDFPQDHALAEHGPAGRDDERRLDVAAALREPQPARAELALAAAAALAEQASQDDAVRVDMEVAYPLFAGVFAADDMTIGTRFNTSHFPR